MLRAIILLAFLLLDHGGSCRAETVTVCAAVSLKEVMTDAGKAYEKDSGDEDRIYFRRVRHAEAQIQNGAPADAFISAADQQIKELIVAKLADESSRRVVAENTLVLILPPDKMRRAKRFGCTGGRRRKKNRGRRSEDCPRRAIRRSIALKAAKIDGKIADKLVYGANVRQVLAYVERGEVDAGIVYATDAREAGDKVKVAATIDDSTHDRIEYPAIILKNATHPDRGSKVPRFSLDRQSQGDLQGKGVQTGQERK